VKGEKGIGQVLWKGEKGEKSMSGGI